ncbi:MAG TPA: HD domain-containing protein [Candidatus Faecisoma merdavium]|nr:HD domain-containing protein [Candidatus Faecisoma merdavium]
MNIEESKKQFKMYVDAYNFDNEKIKLKYYHSLRVSKLCKDIAISLNLNEEDIKVAELLGLLHDFGRFEQVKIYNTFNDKKSVDHAILGVEELKKFGFDKFIEDKKIQKLIEIAILNHNKTFIETNLTERETLFCKIIRDADKIDIFYIIQDDEYVPTNDFIGDKIFNRIINYQVDFEHNINTLENYVIKIAMIYDINFLWSYKYLYDKNYISNIIDKIISTNKQEEKLLIIKDKIINYLKNKEELC